jgi:hypothetical protein
VTPCWQLTQSGIVASAGKSALKVKYRLCKAGIFRRVHIAMTASLRLLHETLVLRLGAPGATG